MAYTATSSRNLYHGTSLGWDLQNLGVLNADMSLVMDGTSSPFFSSLESSDFSTGYLEDALLEFNEHERSKRRRLLLYTTDHDHDHDYQAKVSNDLAKSYWNENFGWEMSENFSCLSHITGYHGANSGEPFSTSMSNISEEGNAISEIKAQEEEISTPEALDSSLLSSYRNLNRTMSVFEKDNKPHFIGDQDKRKKRVVTRVVYPFALVKPGGVEGDMTINDINERILMPPTRPVRHPVGDFACRPCVSAHGPGLSGKAVVALTRIHTQGRGTITIIRTKG